jgi:hypothetical protein
MSGEEDGYEEMKEICPMCNHNRAYHVFIKEMEIVLCKVKTCKCSRHMPSIMHYSTKVLEDMK